MSKDNPRKGLHLHRIHPIVFGGNPNDNQNIISISRLEHTEFATFWNRKIREIKEDVSEINTPQFSNNFDISVLTSPMGVETIETLYNLKLPTDYKDFLQHTNGIEGKTKDNYIVLWSAKELVELNRAYNVSEFVSNILIIGSDGEEGAFAFDITDFSIVKLPFIGMGYISNEKVSDDFKTFLTCQFIGGINYY